MACNSKKQGGSYHPSSEPASCFSYLGPRRLPVLNQDWEEQASTILYSDEETRDKAGAESGFCNSGRELQCESMEVWEWFLKIYLGTK